MGGVDRLILALVCRDLEGAGDGFDSRKDVRQSRFQVNTTGCDQPDSMLEVRLGADVRKKITKRNGVTSHNLTNDGAEQTGMGPVSQLLNCKI